jgi:hypothetical protein
MPNINNDIYYNDIKYSLQWLNKFAYYTELVKDPKNVGYNATLNRLTEQRKKTPLFGKWIPTPNYSLTYLMAKSPKDFDWNFIPFKCPIPGDSLLNDYEKFPSILCQKQMIEFLPIIYNITKDEHIKKSINYATMNSNSLNEYYYIEDNGMYRGEKYKQNLPLDKVTFRFPNPFVYTVSEIVAIGIPTTPKPITQTIIDQPIPKALSMVLINDQTTTTPKPITQTIIDQPIPKALPMVLINDQTTTTTTTIPTTPRPTINKNILIIGGLIGLFLIIKK